MSSAPISICEVWRRAQPSGLPAHPGPSLSLTSSPVPPILVHTWWPSHLTGAGLASSLPVHSQGSFDAGIGAPGGGGRTSALIDWIANATSPDVNKQKGRLGLISGWSWEPATPHPDNNPLSNDLGRPLGVWTTAGHDPTELRNSVLGRPKDPPTRRSVSQKKVTTPPPSPCAAEGLVQ